MACGTIRGCVTNKITTISMLFVFEWYCTGVLIKDAVLIEEIIFPQLIQRLFTTNYRLSVFTK